MPLTRHIKEFKIKNSKLKIIRHSGFGIIPVILSVLIGLFSFGTALAAEFNVIVKQGDMVFQPDAITIQVGDTVMWTNKDDSHHTVAFEDTSVKGSENIKNGGQFSIKFNKPGAYKYYCTYHRVFNMQGTISVK